MIKKFKKINNELGDIYKILSPVKKSDLIQDVYITEVNYNKTKGWNYHKKATSKLIVISGKVEFRITKNFSKIKKKVLSGKDNKFMIIKPKYWFCFRGISKNNRVLNLLNYKHDKNETKKKSIT
ncbi:WxcM-like domain-containing protein [Candidatus Pelagibacter bacterium nBUS_27]|jgi:dTDP-4-dehydrorhamnose 3,5-epimerase-like enzyme|uniref:WxcM-like domain-containing protein n=1 Tax=Candidatus Pelagibacter bacterium nBUS_27 TaxID=3374188 RepID=UPI003EC108C5